MLIQTSRLPAGSNRWNDWRESLPQQVRKALRFDNGTTRQVQQASCVMGSGVHHD